MATTRIKDLSKTATTVNSDANLVLDGNTGGTQKISRDNFRQDTADAFVAAPGTYNLAPLNSGTGKIDAVYLSSSSDSPKGAWDASSNTPTLADGTGTAGDYYDVTVAGSSDLGSGSITFTVGDVVKYNGTVWFKIDSVANILDGVSTIDGAKSAIEIPDVGTAPDEVPLNGMLGDMAYQDSAAISVSKAEVESTTGTATTQALTVTDGSSTNFVVQEDGRVGIGNSSPSSNANVNADDLVVGNGGEHGITIYSGSANNGRLFFSDGTGTDSYRGIIRYDHGSNQLVFGTNSNDRWTINSTGNLVAGSGLGIDFGSTNSTSGVTVDGSVMSEYESGTWTPAYSTTGSAFTTPPTMDVPTARYVRVGDLVTFHALIRTDSVDLTGAGGYLIITGLPYAATASSGYTHAAATLGQALFWANAPAGGYVDHGQSYIYLTKRTSSITGSLSEMTPSDLTAGTTANQNQIMIAGSYYTNA